MSALHLPRPTLAEGNDPVRLTPERAGWTHTGLRVLDFEVEASRVIETAGDEMIVLPLSATEVRVTVGEESFHLDGRTSVFARVTDFLYVGRDSTMTIEVNGGGELALATSRCAVALAPKYGSTDGVEVEVRGAGPATRQVTNFASPQTWGHADKIMCVELLTPDGNWSSYPPHKHDDSPECEVNNEEIYYFRIGKAGTTDCTDKGFGMHRTYTGDGVIDANVAVGDGDVFLVPRGYHGPCIAAPGYTMYYLNVLAGPGGERSMAFCDDPAHHWVRDKWEGMVLDPRCPMTTAEGLVYG